jgi:lipopolysaccharide/colanic/teichoic acid biosynthesis glycosyltransferase
MLRRSRDLAIAGLGLLTLAPLIGLILLLIWLQDGRTPLYVAPRIGQYGRIFGMVKIRTMVARADRSRIYSTAAGDGRVTPLGRLIRRFKLDEVTQLWNVLKGEMRLVGPRPPVALDVALYSSSERELLEICPGLTDLASIVFADEGDILRGSLDPDLDYMQRIRPWKSQISLLYARRRTLATDMRVLGLTALANVRRGAALEHAARLLEAMGAPAGLAAVARRRGELLPVPPPGCEFPITAADLRFVRQQHAVA